MNIEVRNYLKQDYTELIILLKKIYNSEIDQVTLENRYLTNTRSILVATTENNYVVGCAFVEIQQDYIRPRRILYVTYVAVDEHYRKQGIGRIIFKSIETMAVELEATAIELTSADYRKDAHAFYEALGFSKKKTTLFIKEINSL